MSILRPQFAVLITTFNRPHLLARRSLPSIAAQTRRPDLVIIADDSERDNLLQNKRTVTSFFKRTGIRIIHLNEQRLFRNINGAIHPLGGFGFLGKHNSARNAAALTALAEGFSPENDWVAVLDDDDEWLPRHLEQAETMIVQAGKSGMDFMPAAYQYRLPSEIKETRLPPKFNGRDFLVGNPGVEGSTFVLRLSAFLRAGMFDESLPACDDRDLCVRLSLLSKLRYKQPPALSAVYYNEKRPRITTWRGNVQLEGIARFADKYRGWMTNEEYIASRKRAKKLFGWRGETPKLNTCTKTSAAVRSTSGKKELIALVIGVIVNPEEKDNPLFGDILRLTKDKHLSSTDVVVMPSLEMCPRLLQNTLNKLRRMGLRVYCPDKAYIDQITRELAISSAPKKSRPIAINRTILQHAVFSVGHAYRNPVFWILDGDTRLHGLKSDGIKPVATAPNYISEMIRLRTTGCDVAVGSINGAAPLPRALTVRTQMVDLLHFFARLRHPSDKRHFSTLSIANAPRAQIAGDYYHDCGDHPHLEQPVGLPPLPIKCTERRFIRELPRLIRRILAGDAVTRPLLSGVVDSTPHCPHRGGNTLIFNPAVLRACPNGFARGSFASMRRQDEIWRIIGESALGWKITSGNFPVTQTRENEPPQAPDMERVLADIAGHAVSMALRHVASSNRLGGMEKLTNFILRHDAKFFRKVNEFALARTTMIRASFQRIIGIAESMRGMIEKRTTAKTNKDAIAALLGVEKQFSQAMLPTGTFIEGCTADALRETIADFPDFCRSLEKSESPSSWIRNERRKNAEHILARAFSPETRMRFLGQGDEGTVFTDKENVYKVIHRWYSRADIDNPDFLLVLHRLAGAGKRAVYPITNYICDNGDLLLVMPYEKTVPYEGGYGSGMVAMLKDLKEQGIALWDISPKNLRRKNGNIRLIDYGQHVQPFTDRDFDLSVRKAWLCWCFGQRKDIRAMLTASLKTANLAELAGYQNMRAAVEQYAACFRVDDTARDEVLSDSPKRILDYGCSNGKYAAEIARTGVSVDAYDQNLSEKARRRLNATDVNIMSVADIAIARPYDVVLMRHVICEISSDKELIQCLREVRRHTSAKGKAVITACNMDRVVKEKLYAVNIMPSGADSNRKFLYRKQIRINGSIRPHVHRPQRALEHLFLHAGFRIASRKTFADMDLDNFQPCGGVLQWVLKPSNGIAGEKAK